MKRRSTKKPLGKKATEVTPHHDGRRLALVLCVLVAFLAVGVWVVLKQRRGISDSTNPLAPSPRAQITFNKDIAPIIYAHCAGCHRPGEAGPFPLLSYQDVKKRAADIVEVTGRRYMPPWLPEHSGPAMADERRLTENEIDTIRQWKAEGTAEGSPADKPPAPMWTEGWQLGTPDLIAEMPEAYTLPADGKDIYRNFVIPLSVTTRRYVRAVEFKANSKVIHHVFIHFDPSHQSRRLDAQDKEVGFGGMSLPSSVESPGGYFLSWQPGRGPTLSPDGLAWALEPRSDLILQAHMQPSGKPEMVRPRIAFYFTDQTPTNTPFKISLSSYDIDIPAGASSYEIQDGYVLPVDMDLLAILPHAHYLGKKLQGFAVLPNGEKRSLLNIKDWDFNWQSDFRYREPVRLPKGTRIGMRFTYDNSSQNLRNPNHPPIRVTYGMRSIDEMGELWFQMLPRSAADLRTLEVDYGRRLAREILDFNTRMLQQNPTNAHAHIQLGKALVVVGRTAEALSHFRRAVEINPNEEEGNYHLGVMLLNSDLAGAEKAFRDAIRVNPEDFMARNNLGLILMNSGRDAEAERQFRKALESSPNERVIRENLNLLRKPTGRP